LQVLTLVAGGRSFAVARPKFWIEAIVGELLFGDFDRDHLLKGRASLEEVFV